MQTLFDSSREAEGRGEEGVEIGFKQTFDTYLPRGKTFTLPEISPSLSASLFRAHV